MTWTTITRREHDRSDLRFASDMRDVEWALIEPLLPPPSRRGRPRIWPMRAIWEALLFVLSSGCQWRSLPREFAPFTTVQHHFYKWRDSGLLETINAELCVFSRLLVGRAPAPAAAVIDSHSVRTTEAGGPRGFDCAKRVKGRKRHIVTDTGGRLLQAHITPANVQDVHAAVPLLKTVAAAFPTTRYLFADRVYRGEQLARALADPDPAAVPWFVDIVTRIEKTGGFVPERKRWVIERTFAWFGRNRRLAKDFEAKAETQRAWLMLASIKLLNRKAARTLAIT